MRRSVDILRLIGIGASAIALAATVAVGIEAHRLGPPPLERTAASSVMVLDRNDNLLRAFTSPDDKWRLPVGAADVDPMYVRLLLAFEDRRFHQHRGVDPLGYLRIAFEVARHGRLVSGGSTLSMQVARLIEADHSKTARTKLRQMIRAVQLEARLSKREILELYLRLAPFGGNIEGVRAAAFAYFGKEPRRLSYAEAALLVALPQSPSTRRPDRHPEAARRARAHVLGVGVTRGVLSAVEAARAIDEPLPTQRRSPPQLAAHLAELETAAAPARAIHRTTLDVRVQAALEGLVREHVKGLGRGLSAAVVAVDHQRGEIVAEVGSPGLLDEARLGGVDMARAVRSPGSTLKPLIYGLAFDAGLAHPETLIEDGPTRFGRYTPKNFDHDWHGTVSLREALAKSLNIPAVKVLDAIGPAKLHARMTAAGVAPQLPKDAEPSLAIALGGVGLTLRDLAQLYTAIARGGDVVALRHIRDGGATSSQPVRGRLMSEVAAFYLRDILKNAPPPAHARAGEIAYKTGTSYGYRDAWSVGFDGRHTIAVWVGRADGAAVSGLNGRQSAAPLLFDAFQRVGERRTPFPPAPHGVLKATNGDLPATLRRFMDNGADASPDGVRATPLVIAYPPDRAEVDAEPGDGEAIIARAEGGVLPLTWYLDGRPLDTDPVRRDAQIEGLGRGFAKLTVIDARGRSDRVSVRFK